MAADARIAPGSLVLVSGPSRGGKSRWAECLLTGDPQVTYVATAAGRPEDADWQERLNKHRQRRPEQWTVLEAQEDLALTLMSIDRGQSVLIDALGGYVAWNLDLEEPAWLRQSEALIQQLNQMNQTRVIVIEETGWGVVPATRIGCLFRDRLGELAQALQVHADASWLVLQGRAINLQTHSFAVP